MIQAKRSGCRSQFARLLAHDCFATLAAAHGVERYLADVLVDESDRAIGHADGDALWMVALKATAAPGRAGKITSRTVKRFLLHRGRDVEIDGQARADRAAGVGEPDHVVAGGEARNMADHNRIAQSVCDLSKTDRWATVAVVPNTAVIGPTAPADARGGTVRSGKGFIKRFAAATAAVGVARRSNRISNGVLQDKSIA